MKRLWILNDLYVAAEGRRQGVGRALIDRARALAVETGAKGLILETAIKHRYRAPMEIVDGLFALSPEEPSGHQLLGDDRTGLVVRV